MPTYVYETIPKSKTETPEQFEIVQRMADDALTHHPETGQPVRRVISGGIALPVAGSKKDSCCQSNCGCG